MRTHPRLRLLASSVSLGFVALAANADAGSPGFASSRFAVAAGAQRIAAGDLDGDLDRDLLVLSIGRTQSSLSVFLNNGAGAFSPGWSTTLPPIGAPGAADLDVADLDLDGDLDLVLHVPGAASEVRLNDGSASFAATIALPVVGQHVQTAVGLLDAGTVPDLVTYSLNPNGVIGSWRGLGTGAFVAISNTPIGNDDPSLRMQLGDVTNDGVLDLVRAGSFGIEYLPGQSAPGFPTWSAPTLAWFDACADLELAPLDGDNLLDAVVTIPFSGAIEVFRGIPSGGFMGVSPYPGNVSPGAIAVGDFDADSLSDVVVASRTIDVVSILPASPGAIYLNPWTTLSGIRRTTDLITSDLDGDGDLDIAGTLLGGHVVILENQLVP